MNIEYLKYFSELAKIQHYGKAAKALNISQPGLSHAIKSLEEEYGVPLFQKEGRNVSLSRYGKELMKDVDEILGAYLRLEERAVGLRTEEKTVRIGSVYPLAPGTIPHMLKEFGATFPFIIYNRMTRKYVCWLKIMCKDGTQRSTVLTSERLLGPYTIVRTGLRPLSMSAGDFDLAVASDGKAYYYFERVHSETICADLTEDYTNVTGYYSTHFPRPFPPFVREATAHFTRRGKHYLLTSGTTGYLPNPSEVAVADSWHGPYTILGNPHPADESHTSFHSQISSVFKVPGKKDLYIACADRWQPAYQHLAYEDYAELYQSWFDPEMDKTIPERKKHIPEDGKANTSMSDYVWLPIRFEGDKPVIDWKDEWRIEDYG